MNTLVRRLAVGVTALALVFTGACGSNGGKGGGDGTALQKVRYLTGLNVQGRESFIYVAMERGFFKDVGLDVEVKPGAGTEQNLKLLQGGQADFAIVDITGALIEYGKGAFKDFTVVNAVQQRNLACLMALEGGKVSGPKDLEGKKIAFIPGGIVKTLFDTYASLAGIDPKSVTWVNMPGQAMPAALAAGRIDVATQFVVGKPQVENVAKGRKAVVMPYSDFLADLYGNGTAVTRNTYEDKPDLVKKFNDAMLKGLEYAIAHPDEAGKIYAKYQKLQPPPVAAAEVKLMTPYVKSSTSGGKLGALDPNRVARNIAILQGAGAIPHPFEPKDVISFDLVTQS